MKTSKHHKLRKREVKFRRVMQQICNIQIYISERNIWNKEISYGACPVSILLTQSIHKRESNYNCIYWRKIWIFIQSWNDSGATLDNFTKESMEKQAASSPGRVWVPTQCPWWQDKYIDVQMHVLFLCYWFSFRFPLINKPQYCEQLYKVEEGIAKRILQ